MQFHSETLGISLSIKLRDLLTSGDVITNLHITYLLYFDRPW